MTKLAFGRIVTAMITPFDHNLNVDLKKAAQLARHLVKNGTDAVLVNATTGEAPVMSTAEKLDLLEAVKNEVGDEVPVICGTGTNCTKATADFSQEAEKHGADAILVVAPYYNKPPQDAIIEHFRIAAGSVKVPVIAYNIPGRTGIEIKPDTLRVIAEIPNVVAVKESLPSLEPISALSASLEGLDMKYAAGYEKFVGDRPMEIYSGDDSSVLPSLSVGAVGVVSVTSHVAGPLMKEMIEAYFAGNVRRAKELHLRLYPLFTGLFAVANPILIKAALRLQGIDAGGLRMPLREAHADEISKLGEVMKKAGIL